MLIYESTTACEGDKVTTTPETIAERYVKLGLALEAHLPGYVDAYYGPAAWRAEVEAAGRASGGRAGDRG